MGPERLVQIKKVELPKQNSSFPQSLGPQKYSWKSAKVARKLRERRAKAEVPNQRPLPHELTSNKYNFLFMYYTLWIQRLLYLMTLRNDHSQMSRPPLGDPTSNFKAMLENHFPTPISDKSWGQLCIINAMIEDTVVKLWSTFQPFTAAPQLYFSPNSPLSTSCVATLAALRLAWVRLTFSPCTRNPGI